MSVTETPAAYKNYQKQLKSSLKEGLASLPTPRNDYEIVVPENETDEPADDGTGGEPMIADQADVDALRKQEQRARDAKELSLRSQVIQRELPRPLEINMTVLRPSNEMHGLTELQRAEELVKQEMVKMLNYDAIRNPVVNPQAPPVKKNPLTQHLAYLEQHPYDDIAESDLEGAKDLLKEEMGVVKSGMAHGDLSLESYTQVWQECLSQVLYLPSQNRYTRANLASKKDRIESAEKRLEINRKHMAKEAKRCGKIEKKLKILTGGYQARAQALIKQFLDTNEQIEQNNLALSTFKFLASQEDLAIPKRLESLTEDVMRQTEREKALQKRYAQLTEEFRELFKDEMAPQPVQHQQQQQTRQRRQKPEQSQRMQNGKKEVVEEEVEAEQPPQEEVMQQEVVAEREHPEEEQEQQPKQQHEEEEEEHSQEDGEAMDCQRDDEEQQ